MSAVVRLLFFIIAFIICSILAGCTGTRSHATIPSAATGPLNSPDGRFSLVTAVNFNKADMTTYQCVHFKILDEAGKVVHEEQTHASDRMRWDMQWDGDDKVVLNSSDIGTYVWQRQSNGHWKTYVKSLLPNDPPKTMLTGPGRA